MKQSRIFWTAGEEKLNGQEILFGYAGHPIGGIAVAIRLFEGDHIAIVKNKIFLLLTYWG